MARAYATFANGGYRIDGAVFGNQPRVITKIDDASGKVAYANAPVRTRVLTPEQASLLTQLLQGVVTSGTGTAAALPNQAVAGKTGTTENYGDAWFVGYTPQLVTAVWVGYPKNLRPMLTEYHGRPVAGGTFPAPPYLSASTRQVTYRNGQIELDNGLCRSVSSLVYFTGRSPAKTANCKRNEVDVPNVIGWHVDAARARLSAQPLTTQVIYKPATAGQRVGVVVRQYPRGGTLSSFGRVTIVLAKPLHGTVPSIVGMNLRQARAKLRQLSLHTSIRFGDGKAGRVVAQEPRAGVAAAPGMTIRLRVGKSG